MFNHLLKNSDENLLFRVSLLELVSFMTLGIIVKAGSGAAGLYYFFYPSVFTPRAFLISSATFGGTTA